MQWLVVDNFLWLILECNFNFLLLNLYYLLWTIEMPDSTFNIKIECTLTFNIKIDSTFKINIKHDNNKSG